jgi:hypothetical protein
MSSTCSFWWSYRCSLAVRPGALHSYLTGPEHNPLGALCLIRVYALYGRSPRVLGVLMMIGLGAAINASVCLFRYVQVTRMTYLTILCQGDANRKLSLEGINTPSYIQCLWV